MGTLRCNTDVSDLKILIPIILGDPAIDPKTGDKMWDDPLIPDGQIVTKTKDNDATLATNDNLPVTNPDSTFATFVVVPDKDTKP